MKRTEMMRNKDIVKIQRNKSGYITDACLQEMKDSLPIEVFVNDDNEPHRTIYTERELEAYLFGALPYCLTTRFRKKQGNG